MREESICQALFSLEHSGATKEKGKATDLIGGQVDYVALL